MARVQDLPPIRSMLFTPADRPERFAKAAASGADGATLDLEDGVGSSAKDAARKAALEFLANPVSSSSHFVWALRLNHVTTEAGLRDLLALRDAVTWPAMVLIPKTESRTEVDITLAHLSDGRAPPAFVAMIESGRGLERAATIAAHPAVAALAFGGADFAADVQAALAWEPLLFARSRIVQAAAAGGVAAWDMPFLDVQDAPGLAHEVTSARALGFRCKLAIHPGQIASINSTFTPTHAQVAYAKRVLAAFEQSRGGACVVDGKMIDLPVVTGARHTVRMACVHGCSPDLVHEPM